jgi:hypothetical protein
MRALFGFMGILLALAAVSCVGKAQLDAMRRSASTTVVSPVGAKPPTVVVSPTSPTLRITDKVKNDVENAMRQLPARAEPSE